MRRPNWSKDKIARLFEMRDVEQLSWSTIGEHFGISAAGAYNRYDYHRRKRRIAELVGRVRAEDPLPPVVCASAAVPAADSPIVNPKRPRYFHEPDALIRARIDRQGLTAGFLGDPPPGRSALDQRGPRP